MLLGAGGATLFFRGFKGVVVFALAEGAAELEALDSAAAWVADGDEEGSGLGLTGTAAAEGMGSTLEAADSAAEDAFSSSGDERAA